MEIELEDLHVQMEDVVKSKLSVSFLTSSFQMHRICTNMNSPVSTTGYAWILISCLHVFTYSQNQPGLNAPTCFYLGGNHFNAVSTKTTKMFN